MLEAECSRGALVPFRDRAQTLTARAAWVATRKTLARRVFRRTQLDRPHSVSFLAPQPSCARATSLQTAVLCRTPSSGRTPYRAARATQQFSAKIRHFRDGGMSTGGFVGGASPHPRPLQPGGPHSSFGPHLETPQHAQTGSTILLQGIVTLLLSLPGTRPPQTHRDDVDLTPPGGIHARVYVYPPLFLYERAGTCSATAEGVAGTSSAALPAGVSSSSGIAPNPPPKSGATLLAPYVNV